MTSKHFRAFAKMIRAVDCEETRKMMAEKTFQVCHKFNLRMNKDRYFKACNVKD